MTLFVATLLAVTPLEPQVQAPEKKPLPKIEEEIVISEEPSLEDEIVFDDEAIEDLDDYIDLEDEE